MSSLEAWTRRLVLWTVPLLFCVLNLGGLIVYRAGFAGQVESLQNDVRTAQRTKASLIDERQRIRDFLDRVETRRAGGEALYEVHFSTEPSRFTKAIQEVKVLARQAGFEASTLSYPETPLPASGLHQRRFVFTDQGTYGQLRDFINLLELTDQFITLERVTMDEGSSAGAVLSIRLELSTIFVEEPARSGLDADAGATS